MYRVLGVLILVFMSLCLRAAPDLAPIVDLLKDNSTSIMGHISLDKTMQLYDTSWGPFKIKLKLDEKKPLSFSFSDNFLSINTKKALIISAGGIHIQVKSIYYHESTGKFEVETHTPLGIGQKSLNKFIAQKLDELYRPKVITAFNQLKTLRKKKKLTDVKEVLKSVQGIFESDKTPSMAIPTIRGDLELTVDTHQDKKFKMAEWTAEVSNGDELQAQITFVKNKDNFQISEAEISSIKGIRVYGETDYPEIASLNFRRATIRPGGVDFDYDIGAEEVLEGFLVTVNLIKAYAGYPGDLTKECDDIKLRKVRDSINDTLRKEIAATIRLHSSVLLKSGISPELLATFR